MARVPTFVGDGQYVGDGGATLQRLWEFTQWRMIKGCPGRYIIKHKKTNPVLIQDTPVTSLDAAAFLSAALDLDPNGVVVHDLQSEKCMDRVQVVVFHDANGSGGGGGGVITYCKYDPESPENDARMLYVHTLNTASGLQRKLEGLRLDHVLQ